MIVRIRSVVIVRAVVAALLTLPFAAPVHGAASDARVAAARDVAYRVVPADEFEGPVTDHFTDDQIGILELLNRADRRHLDRLSELVIPEAWHADPLAFSPFPAVHPPVEAHPKFLVVDQSSQSFGAYEWGRLVRWGPVNSGRSAHPTPAGSFHLNWRSPGRHSTVNPNWYMPWYFNFHNTRGISFHQYALPGRPASHACVRLLERDARWLYEWGETWTLDDRGQNILEHGTPLWITDCYPFGEPPRWRSLSWLDTGINMPGAPPPDSACR
jgi:hypothetical protein